MNPFFIILLGLWFSIALTDYSEYFSVWQLKEYRPDRFLDFLRSQKGRRFLLKYNIFWRFLLALVFYFVFFQKTEDTTHYFILAVGIDFLYLLYRFFAKKFLRPVFTPKIGLLLVFSVIAEFALYIYWVNLSYWIFIFPFRFLFASLIIILSFFPTRLWKWTYIWRARRKIEKNRHIPVIAITGSYGKTSVKEYIAHILGAKYRVAKNIANQNNDIGVAKTILNTDFTQIDFLILEIGAYRVGDIAFSCRYVQPTIGILTGINEQHLALMGSIENIQKTKYELLRSIPSTGLAVTNSDNPYCREFLGELPSEVQTFGEKAEFHPTCFIIPKRMTEQGVTFSLQYKQETIDLAAPLLGKHVAQSIAPCAIVAKHLGLSTAEIQKQVQTLPRSYGSLKLYQIDKTTILDDSYNANPTGIRAAFDVLKALKGQRKTILVTRGLIELGEKDDSIHREIGEEMGDIVDELVLISPDAVVPLEEGIKKHNRTQIVFKYNPGDLRNYLEQKVATDTIILLAGRLPTNVKQWLEKAKSDKI